ncbi:MAG: glycosyltransferase, partial [Acidimicrobiia bacterium]
SVLSQSLQDLEVIVVDDNSRDDTVAVALSFGDPRVRVSVNDRNLGVAGNWNRAVELARGRYIKVLCNDDVLSPDCLSQQVALLESNSQVALVAGQRDVIDEPGRVLFPARGLGRLDGVVDSRVAVRAAVRSGTNLFGEPVCVLFRRRLIPECGPFSGARPYMIDLDYWCRMLSLGSLYAQRRVVGAFRVVSTSLSVALLRRQSVEAVGLFQELHRHDPDVVRRRDLALGSARAVALATARGVTYRALEPGGGNTG